MARVVPSHQIFNNGAAALQIKGALFAVGRQVAPRERRMPPADAAEIADPRPRSSADVLEVAL